VFIGAIMLVYFGWLRHYRRERRHHLAFSLSHRRQLRRRLVRIRINTFANSRTAFARLRGKPYRRTRSARGRHEHGHAAHLAELVIMLIILLFIPKDYAVRASSGSPSASRSAPRCSAAPAHLHKIATSARTS